MKRAMETIGAEFRSRLMSSAAAVTPKGLVQYPNVDEIGERMIRAAGSGQGALAPTDPSAIDAHRLDGRCSDARFRHSVTEKFFIQIAPCIAELRSFRQPVFVDPRPHVVSECKPIGAVQVMKKIRRSNGTSAPVVRRRSQWKDDSQQCDQSLPARADH